MVEAVAKPEPHSAPNMPETTGIALDRPVPVPSLSVSRCPQSTRAPAMPLRSIRVPARMNRGTARREKDSVENQAVEPQLPVVRPAAAENTIAPARNARGMPMLIIIRARTNNAQSPILICLPPSARI